MLKHLTNNAELTQSKYIKALTELLPPENMRDFISTSFDSYLKENKHKKIQEKCIEFCLYRTNCLSRLSNAFLPLDIRIDIEYNNSLLDYIDMTFSYLFFNDHKEKSAIANRIDNETYFCLLTFALDRIEFPSLVLDQFTSSFKLNHRNQIPLGRRNYLATTLSSARLYVNKIFTAIAESGEIDPSLNQARKIYKENKKVLENHIAKNFAYSMAIVEKSKHRDHYKVYRGYEINEDQNVIINRKIRKQDANRSFSFSTNKIVALGFANYRSDHDMSDQTFSFNDRLCLARTMFSEKIDFLCHQSKKKCILSEYVIPEPDVIFTPINTTNLEFEVFAFPHNAVLTRYSIVNSLN